MARRPGVRVERMTTGAEGCLEWFGRCKWAGEGEKKAGGFCTAIIASLLSSRRIWWRKGRGGRGGRWREGRGRRERGRREQRGRASELKREEREIVFSGHRPLQSCKSPNKHSSNSAHPCLLRLIPPLPHPSCPLSSRTPSTTNVSFIQHSWPAIARRFAILAPSALLTPPSPPRTIAPRVPY